MARNIILQGVNHSDTNLNQSFNREMRSLVPLRREFMIVSKELEYALEIASSQTQSI